MILPRRSLVTIYKSFIKSHLDYGGTIFHQVFNESFHDNLESIQYNALLAVTGAIRSTLKKKALLGIRFRISPTKALVSQAVDFLQDI